MFKIDTVKLVTDQGYKVSDQLRAEGYDVGRCGARNLMKTA
jgi:hypothetical protein